MWGIPSPPSTRQCFVCRTHQTPSNGSGHQSLSIDADFVNENSAQTQSSPFRPQSILNPSPLYPPRCWTSYSLGATCPRQPLPWRDWRWRWLAQSPCTMSRSSCGMQHFTVTPTCTDGCTLSTIGVTHNGLPRCEETLGRGSASCPSYIVCFRRSGVPGVGGVGVGLGAARAILDIRLLHIFLAIR